MSAQLSSRMSKVERDELARLVRRREKLAKADVARVVAERMAEFEHHLASAYRSSDDPVWAELHAAAQAEVDAADAKIAERCRDLGVADQFRPSLSLGWWERGENGSAKRRAELRKAAIARLTASAKTAAFEIERRSVEIQTELVAGGLASDEARRFLERMPTPEALIAAAPSVAELERGGL